MHPLFALFFFLALVAFAGSREAGAAADPVLLATRPSPRGGVQPEAGRV